MAASLLKLGLTRRLTKLKTIHHEGIPSLHEFVSLVYMGFPSKTCLFLKEVSSEFHSSTARGGSRRADKEARREFLMNLLEKKKREKCEVWRNISVSELASKFKKHPDEILEILNDHIPDGQFFKKKTDLITDTKILIDLTRFMGKAPVLVASKDTSDTASLDAFPRPPADPKDLVKRAPVVTIMGHVDHGKTTLLDHLRSSNVVAGEFGGITQHIGAFSVKVRDNESVTFIDTPGHAAFTSMRSRGAHATDIVVLVVAADDGVMEQTVESIRMAQEAGAPIIVAINKIDKPQANIKRTEEMLASHQLFTESMGGDIQAVPISALNGTNVDTLVEAILLQSEIMDLKADPSGLAEGVIIESSQDLHKGKLATAIIQRGTLQKGAILVAGCAHAKVRLMFDESGHQILKATPSTPVEMMGWKELPAAGELMLEVPSEKDAQRVINYRKSKKLDEKAVADLQVVLQKSDEQRKAYLEKRRKAYEQGVRFLKEKKEKEYVEDLTPKVKVIIKGDVDGSVEAILDVLDTYNSSDVPLQIVHYGVGNASETDLELASTFDAIIYCFNVKIPPRVSAEAKKKGIKIRNMNVIYHLVDDVKRELERKMPTVPKEEILGEADVIQQFDVSEKRKKYVVAGIRIKKGEIFKSENVKLIRDDTVLYDGTISSLRHVKAEVNSMKSGTECGLMLGDPTIPVQLGDVIICYKTSLIQQKLDWDPGF